VMNTYQLYLLLLLVVMLIATTAMTVKQMNEIRRLQELRKRPRVVTVEECDGKNHDEGLQGGRLRRARKRSVSRRRA